MFEPERSFSLTEDTSRSNGAASQRGDQQITIPDKMQIFATIHCNSLSDRLRVSAATRSRFTEIAIPAYDTDELLSTMRCVLRHRLKSLSTSANLLIVADYLLALYKALQAVHNIDAVSLNQLLRACDYVCSANATDTTTTSSAQVQWLTYVGARFIVLDAVAPSIASDVSMRWQRDALREIDETRVKQLHCPPTTAQLAEPLAYVASDSVKCSYGDVVIMKRVATTGVLYEDRCIEAHDALRLLGLAVTSTTLKNIARIMVAILSDAPIVLEGPPGSGMYITYILHTYMHTHTSSSSTRLYTYSLSVCPRLCMAIVP
jgi:midasin (ATPase involved in ribosome maturation)